MKEFLGTTLVMIAEAVKKRLLDVKHQLWRLQTFVRTCAFASSWQLKLFSNLSDKSLVYSLFDSLMLFSNSFRSLGQESSNHKWSVLSLVKTPPISGLCCEVSPNLKWSAISVVKGRVSVVKSPVLAWTANALYTGGCCHAYPWLVYVDPPANLSDKARVIRSMSSL